MKDKLVVFGFGVAVGIALAASVGAVAQQGSKLPEETQRHLRKLTQVFAAIKANYVTEVDEAKMYEGCMAGSLRAVDPNSAYYDREEFRELQVGPGRGLAGIGLEVTTRNSQPMVVGSIEGGPAERAGVKPGDVVAAIDGAPTLGMTLAEVVRRMRGSPGSKVRLALARPGAAAAVELEVEREQVRIPAVKSSLLAGGIGYVRLAQFGEPGPAQVVRAIEALRQQNGAALKGLVLDLRNNPGGLLSASVDLASAFLPEGRLVVSAEGRSEQSRTKFVTKAAEHTYLKGPLRPEIERVPLVVLVNAGSAAASEIVAAAFQHYGRAKVVGEKTFGRGSIQTVLPLGDGTALKITSAYFQTPGGRKIEGEGVKPDVAIVTPATARYGDDADEGLKRAIDIAKTL